MAMDTRKKEDEKKPTPTLVAPDGGWGWFIVIAYILMGIFCLGVLQSFGLLYKDYFSVIGLSATEISMIINANSSIRMCTGLMNGPMLKRFGFRKVSLCSSVVLFIGLVLTAQANSFALFIMSYSFVSGLGLGPLEAAHSLALNTYFKKRRSKAMGYAVTGMGMGPIFMPFVISSLVVTQGVKAAGLIQAALSLHTVIGGLLLQPVKWHMKKEDPELLFPLTDEDKNEKTKIDPEVEEQLDKHEMDVHSIYGADTPLPERRRFVILNRTKIEEEEKWHSALSLNTINLGSSWKIFEEVGYKPLSLESGEVSNKEKSLTIQEMVLEEQPKKDNCCLKVLKQMFYFFDFDLLRDPYYINLLAGMSLAMTAEINFSLLTPFILTDFYLSEQQIATVMAVIAVLDLIFRFIAPYIGDGLKVSARIMYMIAMSLLILSRTSLLFASSYTSILAVAAFLGVAKGIRTVYMALVIPAYVPLERLASASGIQMLTNGIFIVVSGPVIGYIRDISGSYRVSIVVINLLTFTAVLIWAIEILWVKYRQPKKQNHST